jgi:cytochrome c oxidase subunit 5a
MVPVRLAHTGTSSPEGGAHAHETESFEAFNQRYHTFFNSVSDLFELQRGLNNCFAYDLVPTTEVVDAALRAARKVNDYATAVRILEGVREKVENKGQYQAYLDELKSTLQELGECLVLASHYLQVYRGVVCMHAVKEDV